MSTTKPTNLIKDLPNRKITVTREFDAPPSDVWRAWTESELLDLWWAPRPYRAETKSLDFRDGGFWLYAMVSPEGNKSWCKVDFTAIDPIKSFHTTDYFCDENGNRNEDVPLMKWKIRFHATSTGTSVDVEISFDQEADLKWIIEMGFEAGFTAALSNLDQYIESQFKLRKQLKTDKRARVSTYLNFPGNTEEAFNFYKSAFQSEFSGPGIQRFGDIPPQEGQPPVAENVKKMVLHIELPITGDHVLMGTDAPAEMGFTVIPGNNMHINLEPETREEALRIFNALSEGGKITMPLQDMFWGAYFGSFTDKYGINWMVNQQ